MTIQPSIYFWIIPRVRFYRNPRQVWLCWLGWSAHSIRDRGEEP